MSGERRRRIWIGIVALGGFTALLTLFAAAVPLSSDTLRQRIIDGLSWRLESDVELASLRMRVFPSLRAQGEGLVVRKRNRPTSPLISVKRFSVDTGVIGLIRKHVTHVELEGLEIQIPPKDEDDHEPRFGGSRDRNRSKPSNRAGRGSDSDDHEESGHAGVIVDTLESTNARLVIVPRKANKAPKVWAIHHLRMHSVGIDQAMPFKATLTNGVPPGEIETSGHFGPWQREEPGDTPLDGAFTFKRADLSVFHGISGTLSAHGTFDGQLGRLDINGETDTPDFTIKVSGHPFPLHVKYHSIVDGTNGDTLLERIDAQFLKSTLLAKGAVLDAPPGAHGRTVSLSVVMNRARLEDVMTMSVKAPKPPMVGELTMTTKFILPPGERDVPERLRLDGRFEIAGARFTNFDVQSRINALSHRSRGLDADTAAAAVLSNFQGRFKLADGILALPALSFGVPGAGLQLSGQYGLKAETLDFHGTVVMDAKISETQKGIKKLLLKAADPLFRKDGGGSAIPIKITGIRNNPSFGLDVRRVFKRGDNP